MRRWDQLCYRLTFTAQPCHTPLLLEVALLLLFVPACQHPRTSGLASSKNRGANMFGHQLCSSSGCQRAPQYSHAFQPPLLHLHPWVQVWRTVRGQPQEATTSTVLMLPGGSAPPKPSVPLVASKGVWRSLQGLAWRICRLQPCFFVGLASTCSLSPRSSPVSSKC